MGKPLPSIAEPIGPSGGFGKYTMLVAFGAMFRHVYMRRIVLLCTIAEHIPSENVMAHRLFARGFHTPESERNHIESGPYPATVL